MRRLVFASVLVLLVAQPLSADPVQWPEAEGGNGHYYEYISTPGLSHGQALGLAMAMEWEGWQGYLVTITSQEENDFISSTLAYPDSVWIGAMTWPWHWSTHGTEPWDYTNWCEGEPDDAYPGNFSAVGMLTVSGCWIDTVWDNYSHGYIVEFGGWILVGNQESTWGAIKSQYR
jgi:hypothetical protein